ncbi:oligosaccharide flippase family protein, partial [Gallibacterium anatis]
MSKKVLISNFLSLSVLQVFSYALPLLTLPYLVKVLTPSYYGLISFSQSIAVFLFIIVDFGFNFSAVRQIASYQNNIKKLIEIFSS